MTKEMAWPIARKMITEARNSTVDESKKISESLFNLLEDHLDHILKECAKWDRNRGRFWKRTNSAPWYIPLSKDYDRVFRKQRAVLGKLVEPHPEAN